MKLPKFVSLNKTALRLIGDSYYRDGGRWSVDYRFDNDVLKSVSIEKSVNDVPLVEITEEEWRKDNGQYAPKNLK